MPIYEYTCNNCSKSFARLQKVGTDSSGITCPNCQSDAIERKVSSIGSVSSGDLGSSASVSAPSCSGFT